MKKVIDRASSRGYFNHGWLKTHHTFSFANYYNPERIHFGALRVLNDDLFCGMTTRNTKRRVEVGCPNPADDPALRKRLSDMIEILKKTRVGSTLLSSGEYVSKRKKETNR